LVAHLTGGQGVAGSNPVIPTEQALYDISIGQPPLNRSSSSMPPCCWPSGQWRCVQLPRRATRPATRRGGATLSPPSVGGLAAETPARRSVHMRFAWVQPDRGIRQPQLGAVGRSSV